MSLLLGRKALAEAEWYAFSLNTPREYQGVESLSQVTTYEGVQTELAVLSEETPNDPPPTLRLMQFFMEPPEGRRELLRALHRPLVANDGGGGPRESTPGA